MIGLTRNLCISVIAAACWSGILQGYNTAIFNIPGGVVEKWIRTKYKHNINSIKYYSNPMYSVVTASYSIGGVIGGLLSGYIATRWGRRGGLLLNNFIVLLAAIIQYVTVRVNSIAPLMIGRILMGVNGGINLCLAPMYVSEVSPDKTRATMGSTYQMFVSLGVLIVNTAGAPGMMGTKRAWCELLLVPILPALIQCAMFYMCPETPKYLMVKGGREDLASRGLVWLRETGDVQTEMGEKLEQAERNGHVKLMDFVHKRRLRKPLVIAVVLQLIQQLTGYTAVVYYSVPLLAALGFNVTEAQYGALVTSGLHLVASALSVLLVDKVGRRRLLLTSLTGMSLSTLLLWVIISFMRKGDSVRYAAIVMIVIFVMLFSIGVGSIPTFAAYELFDMGSLPTAVSIVITVSWLANFIVSMTFISLLKVWNYLALGTLFLDICFLYYVYKEIPETRNLSQVEINEHFR